MAIGMSSSCLYPLETEKSLQKLIDSGIQDTEIFFNAGAETKGELLNLIAGIVKDGGLNVHAVHPYCSFAETHLVFSPYKRRMLDGIEVYKVLCDAAHAVGSDLLIMHGEKEPLRITDEEYIERFAQLEDICYSEDIRLSQENVVHFRSQNPEFLSKMRSAMGKRFRMTFDVKQAVRTGLSPMDLAHEFHENIVHIHISDHGPMGDCLAPGKGKFDFAKLFSTMREYGYAGNYMVELYRSSYADEEELMHSFEKVAKIHAKTIEK